MSDETPELPQVQEPPPEEPPRKKRKREKPKRSRKRRALGWALRLTIYLFVFLLAVLVLVIHLPLDWVMHELVLPRARDMLKHDDIELGAIEYYLFDGLEIHDVRIGPPKGYTHDVFTAKSIRVHYDLLSALDGELVIDEVDLVEPKAFLEIVDGKPNIVALLENLPPSEEKEEEPSEPPDFTIRLRRVGVTGFEAGFDDGKNRLAFRALDVAVSGKVNPAKGSHIEVKVRVAGSPPGQPNITLAATEPQPLEAELELKTDVKITIDLGEKLADPKVRLQVDHLLRTHKIVTTLPVPPVELAAHIDAYVDVTPQKATLENFGAHFNGEELLALSANVQNFEQPDLSLRIERARLPFALLMPFAKAFLPPNVKLELVGEAGIEALEVKGRLPELQAGALPEVTGRIYVRGLGVDFDSTAQDGPGGPLNLELPQLAVKVAGIETAIAMGVAPDAPRLSREAIAAAVESDTPERKPTAFMHGSFGIGSVDGFGAAIRDFSVRWRTGVNLVDRMPTEAAVAVDVGLGALDGFGAHIGSMAAFTRANVVLVDTKPTLADVTAGLRLPDLRYHVPGMGAVALRIATDLSAGADLTRNDFDLHRLTASVNDTIAVRMNASARAMGEESFNLDVVLEPIELPRLIAMAPPGAQAQIPRGLELTGAVGGEVHVSGKVPPPEVLAGLGRAPLTALRLPIDFSLQGDLRQLSVKLPAEGITVKNLDGSVRIAGRPSDVTIDMPRPLGIERVAVKPQFLVVERISLPFRLHFTPFSSQSLVALDAGVKVERVAQGGARMKANVEGIAASIAMAIKLPLARALGRGPFDIERIDTAMAFGLESASVTMPDLVVEVPNETPGDIGKRTPIIHQQVAFVYDPRRAPDEAGTRYPMAFTSRTKVGQVQLPKQKIAMRDLVFEQATEIAGLELRGLRQSNPIPRTKPRWIKVTGGLRANDDADADASGDRRLSIAVGGTPLRGAIAGNTFDVDLLVSIPQLRYPPVDKDLFAEVAFVRLRKFDFRNRSHGPRFSVDGEIGPLTYPSAAVPPLSLRAYAGIELPRATERDKASALISSGSEANHDRQAIWLAGSAGFEARLVHSVPGVLEFRGAMIAEDLNAWVEKHGFEQQLPDGTQVFSVRNIRLNDFDARVPLVQHIDLGRAQRLGSDPAAMESLMKDVAWLWPASRQIRQRSRSPVYVAMRPYSQAPSNVNIEQVQIDQHFAYYRQGELIDEADVPLSIDALAGDVQYRDWVFDVRRFYLRTLTGDVESLIAAQIKSLDPPDLDLVLKTEVTGVNLAALNVSGGSGKKKKKLDASTEISFATDMDVGLGHRDINGFVHISKLSLAQLDELLKFVDPARRNKLIQDQRRLINAYAVRDLAAPLVKYVHLGLEHSSLDFETAFGGAWGVRHTLNFVVDSLKVENIDARSIIDNVLADRAERTAWRKAPRIGAPPSGALADDDAPGSAARGGGAGTGSEATPGGSR